MAELFMINLLATNSKNVMKLERLQHDKEMIIQQDVCWIINNLKTITNWLRSVLARKESYMPIQELSSKSNFIVS